MLTTNITKANHWVRDLILIHHSMQNKAKSTRAIILRKLKTMGIKINQLEGKHQTGHPWPSMISSLCVSCVNVSFICQKCCSQWLRLLLSIHTQFVTVQSQKGQRERGNRLVWHLALPLSSAKLKDEMGGRWLSRQVYGSAIHVLEVLELRAKYPCLQEMDSRASDSTVPTPLNSVTRA